MQSSLLMSIHPLLLAVGAPSSHCPLSEPSIRWPESNLVALIALASVALVV
jgi:hypothetical protein